MCEIGVKVTAWASRIATVTGETTVKPVGFGAGFQQPYRMIAGTGGAAATGPPPPKEIQQILHPVPERITVQPGDHHAP
jgi:hypothetical protein